MATQFLFPGRRKIASTSNVAPAAPAIAVTPGSGGVDVGISGSPPAAPPDLTVATPAAKMVSWGGGIHTNLSTANYALWKGWGFGGHFGLLGGGGRLPGYGDSQAVKVDGSGNVISAGANPTSAYNYQAAYEGLPVSAVNGNQSGFGLFVAAKADPSIYCGFHVRMAHATSQSGGPFGDTFNSTLRADVTTKFANLGKAVRFLAGRTTNIGIGIDLEEGNWGTPAGHTAGETNVIWEQFGYECGLALWGATPTIDLFQYSGVYQDSWHDILLGNTHDNLTDNHAQFMFGLARGHQATGATGRIVFADAQWYRSGAGLGASTATGLKWNSQGLLARLSRTMTASVYDWIAPYYMVTPFSWAGSDNSTFYKNTQEGQPTYTNGLEQYRQGGQSGVRIEYTYGSPGHPGRTATEGGQNIWVGGNNYLTASGRTTAMASAASTSGTYSTAVPTIGTVATSGRSGDNITLTFNASHPFGIHYVDYKVFASDGTTLVSTGAFQMTFDTNSGTYATGLAAARMNIAQQIVAAAGSYVVVTAHAITTQAHSVVVSV